MKARLAKSVFWIVCSRGVVQGLTFCATLVVARLLQPEDYGVMALAVVWTNTLALVAGMGLGAAIIQFQDMKAGELNACFWVILAAGVAGYMLVYGLAPLYAGWLANHELTAVLRVAGLGLVFSAVRVVPESLLRKELRFERVSQAEIMAMLASIGVTLTLALLGAGVWALVFGAVAMTFVQSIATFGLACWRPGLHIGGDRMNRILQFSLATLGSQICWMGYRQADSVILGKISGEATLGFYSMAKQLATLPVAKVTNMVSQLAFPVMAELQDNRSVLRSAVLRAIRFMAWVTFPLTMGLMLVAEEVVEVLLTVKWLPAVPIVQVLCLLAIVQSVDSLLPMFLMARYRARTVLMNNLVLLAVMPFAFWGGAFTAGAVGVAAAWVIGYPVIRLTLVSEALRELSITWKTLWIQVRSALTATVVMMISVLGVEAAMIAQGSHLAVTRLVFMSLSGACVYVLCLRVFGGQIREEIQEVVEWVFRRGRIPVKAQ